METSISGVVKDGLIVPSSRIPEGAQVEIHVRPSLPPLTPIRGGQIGPRELRAMPRPERQAILAVAAAIAEQDYQLDKELTGFDAFSEEELDGGEPNSR